MKPRLLRPAIVEPWWTIGPKPSLDGDLPLLSHDYPSATERERCQPNDHCIFRAANSTWQLWACVRRTPVGRLFVNWESQRLTDSPWRRTGRLIRADRSAGESMVDWHGEEFLQSPFVVQQGQRFVMLYGGYDSGVDQFGGPTDSYDQVEKQTCMMVSTDGIAWQRHRDPDGHSRVFVGPGAVRDQCVVKFGALWHAYYAGHHDEDRSRAAIYVRTSPDLLRWSPWRIAEGNTADTDSFIPESPFVVFREGHYYLFRTHGPRHGTYVFRSLDPLDFGTGHATESSPAFVCHLPVIAPEIVVDHDGAEYISRIDDPLVGYQVRLARLRWEQV
jgi:hypothetical protein